MKYNFVYEISDKKFLIGNYENKKLKNKKYYFGKLEKLEFEDKIYYFLPDHLFEYENILYEIFAPEKFTIKELQKLIKEEQKKDFILTKEILSDIEINNTKSNYLLGKTGNLKFRIGYCFLHKKHLLKLEKAFGKNTELSIYPSSFFSIKCINQKIKNGTIISLLQNKTKIINLENYFYKNIEVLPLGLSSLEQKILEVFPNLNELHNLNGFQQKVYEKILKEFIEVIGLFIKTNIKNKPIFLISNTEKYPLLSKILTNYLEEAILPLKIKNKEFKSTEKLDIFCIEGNIL